ncbi:MAG TPA: hypothetical protein VH333_04290 [Pseudonocardiaceae bacterium]|jgi:hypothetical protein|nr:hypothetical protein [Pseudonocardiaceae bacterium]
MSVETTTGSSDAIGGIESAVSETVARAEQVLSHRFGATIRLADPEHLGGSGRSTVVRVRVASSPFSLPRTLVVKRYGPASLPPIGDEFVQEAVSYQLFTAFSPEDRMCPEMFAHDGAARLVVLEDLGRAPTLADKLLAGDARAAERALLSWSRSLGRLHASTAGREADFDALSRRLGVSRLTDPLSSAGHQAFEELPELLADAIGVVTSGDAHRRAAASTWLLDSHTHRAFSPSDACPDNNVITSRGVRFLDFEGGCWRNVLLDAGYLRVPFPSCWCSFSLPPGMTEAMVAAWRAEIRDVWPDLDDDAVLLPALLDAQLLWVWVSTWWFLPRQGEDDDQVGSDARAPLRSIALRSRWLRLATEATRAGEPDLAAHAQAVAAGLANRFGDQRLPAYPAFRKIKP